MPEREIKKITCEACCGNGKIRKSGALPCDVCELKGWIEDGDGEPILCPDCGGDGHVYEWIDCSECKGRAYLVKIIEVEYTREPCADCCGEGVQDGDCHCSSCGEYVGFSKTCRHCGSKDLSGPKCDSCDGTGFHEIRVERKVKRSHLTGKAVQSRNKNHPVRVIAKKSKGSKIKETLEDDAENIQI